MAGMRGPSGRALEALGRGILRPWFGRPARTAEQILASRPRRILIVRPHNQIGDTVCATPAFAAIRSLFPASRLHCVCAPRHEPVLRHNPDLDGLLVFDRKRFNASARAAFRFRAALRALRPDGAFVLNSVSFSATSALIAAASGARWIVGGASAPMGWQYTGWLYSLEMPFDPDSPEPAARQGPLALRAVGFPVPDPLPMPVFVPGDAAERKALEFLRSIGPGRSVGLHPGAGKPPNRWPAQRFAAVAAALRERGLRPWVLEGPEDAAVTAAFLAALGEPCPVLRGVDLCVVGAALRHSHAVLMNDSGPMHVAGASGARGVVLFGPTPASVWAPPSPRLIPIQAADGRIDSIGVEEVLLALDQSIGRER